VSLPILLASFESATAREPFFSSLRLSSKDESRGVTLPSPRAAASLRAAVALSNFLNSLSLRLG
jgi:hypothetical protein